MTVSPPTTATPALCDGHDLRCGSVQTALTSARGQDRVARVPDDRFVQRDGAGDTAELDLATDVHRRQLLSPATVDTDADRHWDSREAGVEPML
jgi:hypothetical protein